MKKIFAVSLIVAVTAVPARAEDRRNPKEFFAPDQASTQLILGSAETVIASLLASSALKGVRDPKLREAVPGEGTIHKNMTALRNAQAQYEALKTYQKSIRPGIIRSVKLLGASVLFVDAAGRVYEWYGTDAKPSYSPMLSYLSGAEKIPLDDMPETSLPLPRVEKKDAPKADAMPKGKAAPVPDPKAGLEDELRKKLEGRLAKVNPGYRKQVQKEIDDEVARKAALAKADKEKKAVAGAADPAKHAGAPVATDDRTAPSGHFKTRPMPEEKELASKILFGGDLVAGTLLLRSMFTNEGAKAVRSAEEALAKARATVDAPAAGGTAEVRAAMQETLALQRSNLTLQRALTTEAGEIARITNEIATIDKQITALADDTAISLAARERLIAAAEKQLTKTRELALKTSKSGSMIKGVKIVGSALLFADAIGRVYEWHNNDPDPQFSPAMTYIMTNTEKPVEQVWQAMDKYLDPAAKEVRLQDAYRTFRGQPLEKR